MVVHNPGTVRAVQRAVCFGEPMISRVVTLTGEALQQNEDVKEFYLGGGERRSFKAVKSFRRRKRWL